MKEDEMKKKETTAETIGGDTNDVNDNDYIQEFMSMTICYNAHILKCWATVLLWTIMELEQFLKVLFDKQVDNYPNIRENILCNLSHEDANSVYYAFRFVPSQAEKLRCVGYTYFDHGIILSCDIMKSNLYPVHKVINSKESMIHAVNTIVSKWIERIGISSIPIVDGRTMSSMSMSSENIEFYRSISIFICKEKTMVPYDIVITTKVIRKSDAKVVVIRSKLETPMSYTYSIFEKLNTFCASLVSTVSTERVMFENMLSMSTTPR